MAFRIHGVLNEAVLERCLTEITRRHAILRTAYEVQDGQPVQRVLAARSVHLRTKDLRNLPEADRLPEVGRIAREAAWQPFNLETGPMHTPLLLRLGAEDHMLVLALHHIAFDGWSAEIFQEELRTLYAAFEQGAPSPLPALPMQYTDFARWQRQRQETVGNDTALAYWKRQLADLPAELGLPTDRPRPQHPLVSGTKQPFNLSAATTQALKTLSLKEDVTLFTILLAAFQVLLGRHARQQDVAVGVPVPGRTLTETEPLVGCFINMLVLRADLSTNPSFRAMLGQTRNRVLEALSHQEPSFARVVDMMKPERHVGRAPLVQVSFQLRNQPRAALQEGGSVRFAPFAFDTGLADGLDLSLGLIEVPDGLTGTIVYSTDLFDAETIARLSAHYRSLLDGLR